jgi:DNA-3-methyladenine glycosylase II
VNAVVYQQVSLHAASAVVHRLIREFGRPLQSAGAELYGFPTAEHVLAASDEMLRGMGLSANKLATLRRAAEASVAPILEMLGTQKDKLYFHLLLARLEERGEAGRPSIPLR